MDLDVLGDLNWLAVIVATLAYFFLGALWFAPPVLGNTWQKAGGYPDPQEGQGPGAIVYVGPLATCFLATVATAMIVASTATTEVADGIVLGLVVGIGYAVAIVGTGAIFETKPAKGPWFAITAGYHVVGLTLAAVILALWD